MIELIYGLDHDALTGESIYTGVGVAGGTVSVVAFALAAFAFFGASQERGRRLTIAAVVLGIGFALELVSGVIEAVVDIDEDASGRIIGSDIAGVISDAVLAAGAFIVASAFAAHRDLGSRDWRIGVGAVLVGVSFVAGATSGILLLTVFSDLGATGGFTAGLGVASGGELIGLASAVIAAAGCFSARGAGRRGHSIPHRELWLGVAAAVLLAAFSVVSLGGIITSASAPGNGFPGAFIASFWLYATSNLGIASAAACGCAAFFATRRSLTS